MVKLMVNAKEKVFMLPRCARIKSFDSVYHIMVRSISDAPLFRCSHDKDVYLKFIKKYQETFLFKVYAFCLMDNHAHILINCCGADISKIMHGINQCYAMYYNREHDRRGHLFQDRFKSKILHDDRAIINVSAYINKNPKDKKGYKGKEEKYRYSSFGIYMGVWSDEYGILDPCYVLNQFSKDPIAARRDYFEFAKRYDTDAEPDDMEFRHEAAEYRSELNIIVRNILPEKVVEFAAAYTKIDKKYISIKYIKDVTELKALSAFLMRCLCNMSEKGICRYMGNITQTHAARLYNMGMKLVKEKAEYKNIISDFLEQRAA
jgi:REP element-mobilizing transposase RayT